MKKLLLIGSRSVHVKNYYFLVKDYFDEVILITGTDKKDVILPELKTIEVDFSIRNPFTACKTVKQIRKAILETKPDIIHVHQAGTVSSQTLKAAKNIDIPKIVTAWGSDILLVPSKGYFYSKLIKYVMNNADFYTSDSLYMADEMQRLSNSRKLDITIANFGVEIPTLNIKKENIIYSNRSHNSLYRIDKIIEAFALFVNNNKDTSWKLFIAGDGEYKDKLIALTKNLGIKNRVEFLGWLDKEKNQEYYMRAKIFVSIPESDATSISLLEAMAAGTVPVVSDIPANREWVTKGTNGLIVKNIDSDFISEAVAINLENASGINKQIIKERGTKEVNRIKFCALYDRALKSKNIN